MFVFVGLFGRLADCLYVCFFKCFGCLLGYLFVRLIICFCRFGIAFASLCGPSIGVLFVDSVERHL